MIKVRASRSGLLSDWGRILDSGKLTEGEYTSRFEEKVSERYGQPSAAFSSAGAALFSVFRCLGVRRVLVPNNTFFATGAMAMEAGCTIELVDCGPDLSMSVQALETAHQNARYPADAVVLTHIGGGLAQDYEAIARYCYKYGLLLIEDAAHAFGTKARGLMAGYLGQAAVFSFYATKAVPLGEGGVAISKNPHLVEDLKVFRNYGKTRAPNGSFLYSHGGGFNFRMDELHAALGYHQMLVLDDILESRQACAARLMDIVKPIVPWELGGSNWHKYPVLSTFPSKKTVGKVYAESDHLATSLHMGGHFPMCKTMAARHICLPIGEGLYAGMSSDEIHHHLTGA